MSKKIKIGWKKWQLMTLFIMLMACQSNPVKVNDIYIPELPTFKEIPNNLSLEEENLFLKEEHKKSLIWFSLFRKTNPKGDF